MAEAEDVLVDVARHATVYARGLWQRHRGATTEPGCLTLNEIAERLNLLIVAVFGTSIPIRVAQAPAPVTLLTRVFRRESLPKSCEAIPATDGVSIWLPGRSSARIAAPDYRCMALMQAMRAVRSSVALVSSAVEHGVRDLYLLLEACSAECALIEMLPGMRSDLEQFRLAALDRRPPLDAFVPARKALECLAREAMQAPGKWSSRTPQDSLERAIEIASAYARARDSNLYLDLWTGDLRSRDGSPIATGSSESALRDSRDRSPRSARLARRPEIRKPREGEDDEAPGPWMVQTSQPSEHIEDPLGMQRPADQDDQTSAEELGDSLSELPEARVVRSPESAKEVLIADDMPPPSTRVATQARAHMETALAYPEWDWREQAYRTPGATVHLHTPEQGSFEWAEQTLRKQRTMCDSIRRHFELLRANRMRLRRQLDGDEIDLEAYVEAQTDYRAGRTLSQAVYQTTRALRRDVAISLLVDVSGSTDAWVNAHRRIVDVEREALLFVCIALEGLKEAYNVLAFSGVGPGHVTIRELKGFDEPYGDTVARRIAALEPERYTRVGAAIRHASATLMRQSARHRLLILLSDGKPNDEDEYDGRYGIEDARQAVVEARMQGIASFCLTIDRQAASYLPYLFGPAQYALLPKPELLPRVLLDWLRRLIAA